MNKTFFWRGFATGGIIFILLLISIFSKIFIPPDISLNQIEVENLNGDKILLAEYIGKPLVVNYWATWCAPCIKEFPYFEEAKQEFGDAVNFIVISDESLDKIIKFSKSKPYSFNYMRSDKSLGSRPTTYFYNAQGELSSKHIGSLDFISLKNLIEEIY